jgi:acyl-coenzyme A thioesterase PaaI-like protein
VSTEKEIHDEELELDDYRESEENAVILSTHENINRDLNGELLKLEKGYVELRLTTTSDMVVDDQGLIHSGFVFSAADFAAMAAVNERNVVSPVKFGDEVNFVARVRHTEGRKRNIYVEAHVLDIKVFEGEFKTVITDRHVLKLKLLEDGDKALKRAD